ncbi:class I adenylate-forming enzyme family protein [Vagococcus zengguangii]|uniref:Acyl-CoA synthetase n=1 Tax=Vagococcus zengguangii TaxID=2571750 RepID=A0A4D7CUB1_9ENTE|nr:acyl-CoA synthetase [Vagococcus zengguangii]QCI85900.1 acyl-CoA synthetase [Vagococcus zengguangii]TLG78390.1 acyl-CoA synthetase [Vagococcus zengguangii]
MDILSYQPLNLYSNYQVAAQEAPTTPIIFDEVLASFPELGTHTTYEQSLEIIKKRAYQLARLGVKKEDKIIIFKSPRFDTYLLAVAASYLGAVPAMISYHFPTETMEVFVDRLENPFILFDDETKEVVEAISNSSADRKIEVAKLLEQPATPVEQGILPLDQISYMTHTSGTTGIPKLICHSANSMGWRTLWQRTIFTRIEAKRLVAFHISPVHSRFNIGVSSLMAMGFPMMPISSSDSQVVADMVEKHQPIAMETHPNNFVQWTFTAKARPEAFASLKYFHSTFDAINNGTMKTFLEAAKANDPIFLQVYGQSECGPMILKAHTLDTIDSNNARNMGIGLEGLTKARIADPEGNELPANTDGHIHFLSKGRALTYYKEDDRFQSTVHGEWWDSGDWGMIDDNGQLYLKDRQVDLIKNINSNLALEDYLLDNLDFLAEVVIVRDKDNLPQPIIALGPDEEMDWDAWWKQIEDLPHLNHPIIKPFEEIPRTATMKVQRLQIEKEFKTQ